MESDPEVPTPREAAEFAYTYFVSDHDGDDLLPSPEWLKAIKRFKHKIDGGYR